MTQVGSSTQALMSSSTIGTRRFRLCRELLHLMMEKSEKIKSNECMLYDELARLFRTVDLDKGIAQYIRDQVHTRFMNIWIK